MKFIDCIKAIDLQEAAPLVENSATYRQMIDPALQELNKLDPLQASATSAEISKYRLSLKRTDRVVWALRWVRLAIIRDIVEVCVADIHHRGPESYEPVLTWARVARNKYIAEFLKSNPVYGNDPKRVHDELEYFDSRRYMALLNHFMSYCDPQSDNYIREIDAVVWHWQSPDQISSQLDAIEAKWQETRGQEVPHAGSHYDNAREIINFGDGFGWWNLGVQYCDTEGKSMGHCGNNSYMKKPGDILLSLREDVKHGTTIMHRPCLTFILNNGWLGEMKGRGNQTPAPQYHPYILALLKSKYITGIRGGGYRPENNFSVYNLTQEQQDDLIAAKPELEPLLDKYHRLGAVPEVFDMAHNEARSANLPDIVQINDDGTVILQHWDDLESLSRDVYRFAPMDAIVKAIENQDETDQDELDAISDGLRLDDADVFEILSYLEPSYIKSIADSMGAVGDVKSHRFLKKIALHIDRSKYRRLIADAITATSDFGIITDDPKFIDYIRLVLYTLVVGTNLSNANLLWDGGFTDSVDLTMSLRDFIDGVVELMTEDDDNRHEGFEYISGKAKWFDPQSYELKERWGEFDPEDTSNEGGWNADEKQLRKYFDGPLGLNKTNGDDPGPPMDEINHRAAAQWLSNHINTTPYVSKGLFNSRKPETELDVLIEDIKRRAGI